MHFGTKVKGESPLKVTNLSTPWRIAIRYCNSIVYTFYRSYEQYAVIEVAYLCTTTVSSGILMLRGGLFSRSGTRAPESSAEAGLFRLKGGSCNDKRPKAKGSPIC